MRKFKRLLRSRKAGVLLGLFSLIGLLYCASVTTAVLAQIPQLACSQGHAEALGINVNNLSWDALAADNVINALEQSKVGWIRINMYWGVVERTRGQFNWAASDTALARLQNAHINVLVSISGPTPCWALMSKQSCSGSQWAPENVNDWVSYVTAVVGRYHNQVHYWELWNEPDLIYSMDINDPEERLNIYRDRILIPGAQAVHQTDPDAKVIAPVFASIPSGHSAAGPDLVRAFSQVMKGAGASLVDIVSFHSYYPNDVNVKANSFRQAMQQVGMAGKPIWITEVGLESKDLGVAASVHGIPFVESKQADFLVNQISTVLAKGTAQKVFWFALTDSANVTGEHTNHYGLIDNDDYKTYRWRPRPAFTALQQLISNNCSH